MVYFLYKAYDSGRQNCCFARSLPVRGAWVEIYCSGGVSAVDGASLPVRGAWVEIALALAKSHKKQGRSPCGERGLK